MTYAIIQQLLDRSIAIAVRSQFTGDASALQIADDCIQRAHALWCYLNPDKVGQIDHDAMMIAACIIDGARKHFGLPLDFENNPNMARIQRLYTSEIRAKIRRWSY